MTPAASTRVRRQVMAGAWWAAARSASWRTPLAAAGLSLALVIQHRLTQPAADAASFTPRAQLVAAIAAAAAATLLDDPAAVLVATSPTTRAWRTGLRVTQGLLAWSATWAVTLALIATAAGTPPVASLTRQALALLAVAVGVAAIRGAANAAAAVGLVTFSALMVPDRWSLLSGEPAANWRLALLGLAGGIALVWASRDGGRRHHSRGHRGA